MTYLLMKCKTCLTRYNSRYLAAAIYKLKNGMVVPRLVYISFSLTLLKMVMVVVIGQNGGMVCVEHVHGQRLSGQWSMPNCGGLF